jgi:hypothetical protein
LAKPSLSLIDRRLTKRVEVKLIGHRVNEREAKEQKGRKWQKWGFLSFSPFLFFYLSVAFCGEAACLFN